MRQLNDRIVIFWMTYSFKPDRWNKDNSVVCLCILRDSWLLSNMLDVEKINCIFFYLLQGCSSFEEKRWKYFLRRRCLWAASCFFFRLCLINIFVLQLVELLSVMCAQGPVSQSAVMNYDRPVTECHLGEIDGFTASAGQRWLAASLTPAVAENDFSHGLLLFLHSE